MRFLAALVCAVSLVAADASTSATYLGKGLKLHPHVKYALDVIAGHEIGRISCDLVGPAGVAYYYENRIAVGRATCLAANALARGERPALDSDVHLIAGAALSTLAHEANHLSGHDLALVESWAQCRAIQLVYGFAWLLGADEAYARSLGQAARVDHILIGYYAPQYSDEECRDGGDFDLFPWPQGDWPNP